MKHDESKIQINCVKWFRLQYPHFALNLFAVPNGGQRGKFEAKIMKGEGVTAGVSDLLLLIPSKGYHGLCIEMKTIDGRQRDTQKAWQKAVENVGYKYVLCRSIESFIAQVNDYLR